MQFNYIFCLMRGHTLSSFTYKSVDHQYCLRCGKIDPKAVFKKNSSIQDPSQYLISEAVGMLRMTNLTR